MRFLPGLSTFLLNMYWLFGRVLFEFMAFSGQMLWHLNDEKKVVVF